MAKIISFINQKGGVGKTTSAVNLASYLAALGKYVLLVDLDPQANATAGLGFEPESLERSLYHSLLGQAHPLELVKKTNLFGYELMPSSSDLAGAAVELVSIPNREFRLYELLNSIRTNYDYIIIDSPPSLGLLTINGLVAADEVIVPVQCEYYALEGLGQLLKTVNLIQENLGKDLKIKGALLTMFDKRNKLAQQVAKEVRLHFPGYVFESVIPRCIRLTEAPSFGRTILQYDPSSKGGKAYRQLAEEFLRMES
ncbi:MAG: ParA family protein [Candidatus Portnoybacteria bacterium]|nr:ParA family protein [Candidatus Portnoybacteria bacterium]